MTGAELKAIRKELGLSALQLGLAIGYKGNPRTIRNQVRNLERNRHGDVPIARAIIATLMSKGMHQ